MLNNISWASYTIALIISLCLYYAFVLIRYYRHDMQQYVRQLQKGINRFLPFGSQKKDLPVFENVGNCMSGATMEESIPELLLQLQSIIRDGAARSFPKEELLMALKLHLKKLPDLPDNNSKETINDFIKAQCENYCSIHLSGEEERVLWID